MAKRTVKTRYWIVMTLNKKYLVYGVNDFSKNIGKSWNAVNFFVKDERRATRFNTETDAALAIAIMNTYLHGTILLATKEIWE